MTLLDELLTEFEAHRDEKYAAFNAGLINCSAESLIGVRVPELRKIAKKYVPRIDELFAVRDDRYEVKFVKLAAAARLEYAEFLKYLEPCVALIDNWALCDCFSAKCIARHREEFRPYMDKFLSDGREFYQRYALTTLLSFYVEEQYLGYIFDCLTRADCTKYYVHMAAAWLVCEVIVKHYERGTEFLRQGTLDRATHNKAIQKSAESFRLNTDQKNYLKSLKR